MHTHTLHAHTHTSHAHTHTLHAHTQNTVYRWVVDDVVKNVRDDFLNEGIDQQVLDELKTVSHMPRGRSWNNSWKVNI